MTDAFNVSGATAADRYQDDVDVHVPIHVVAETERHLVRVGVHVVDRNALPRRRSADADRQHIKAEPAVPAVGRRASIA